MEVKVLSFNFERIENTVLHHYAVRLTEYGYRPGNLRQAFYRDSRGMPRMFSLYEFVAGNALRVVFYVAKNAYRIKIVDGDTLVYRSPFFSSAQRWERPFLYFFNDDDRPIYPVKETWAEAKARRRAEDKAAGIKTNDKSDDADATDD